MGRKSRSRSRDRSERKSKHKDRRSRSRSRDHKRGDGRHERDDRRDHKRDDRFERPERRDNRGFERPSERVGGGGGWGQPTGPTANYEEKIKSIVASRFTAGSSKWAAAPENVKIYDDNGEISEEFLKSTQGPANSQKLVQQELSIKFSQHLNNSKTIKPKIDQTDIESRNRYLGSADPYEQGVYGVGANTVNSLSDKAKLIRKIYIPKNNTFNYTGFIIGPKGTNQKRLEEETGCKILVRGKGFQKEGQPGQAEDNEDLHVLVAADDPETLAKGVNEIEKIIFADEATRNELKRIQLNLMAQIKTSELGGYQGEFGSQADLSFTTPYGPPSMDARAISVPKDCIGLVIGKGGENIKRLQAQSGATKVQVAANNAPGSDYRNVFIEGSDEAFRKVKALLGEIVENHNRLLQAQQNKGGTDNQVRFIIKIPSNIIGMVIGKSGETIKYISNNTGAVVYMDKEEENQSDLPEKTIIVTGTRNQAENAKKEIEFLVKQKHLTLRYFEQKPGEELPSEALNKPQYTKGGFSTPGYENLHELQKWLTTENWFDYYNNTSTVTTTEYHDDGTVKVVTDTADNNLESMPDISKLMKVYLPAPKEQSDAMEGEFIDPNMMRSEEDMRRNGGRYFDTVLEGLGMQKPDRPVMANMSQSFTLRPAPIIEQAPRAF